MPIAVFFIIYLYIEICHNNCVEINFHAPRLSTLSKRVERETNEIKTNDKKIKYRDTLPNLLL